MNIQMLYPIVTKSRTVIDLSGVWKFRMDHGNGFNERWYERDFAGEESMTMPVPASYNDLKENAELRDHFGWVFYQRKFTVPNLLKTQRIMLRFDAVTHSAVVWLNGKKLGMHKGGFLPFEFEIGEWLAEDENILTVAVDNRIDYSTLPVGKEKSGQSMLVGGKNIAVETGKEQNHPNFDFFNYCGITRPVRLYTTPAAYLQDISLDNRVEGTRAKIKYELEVSACQNKQECRPVIEILKPDGTLVGKAEGICGEIKIPNVCLWEPLNPYLYEIRVSYGEDCYSLPYGIRTVEIQGGKFLINGKPFYFKGYGKHEDTFPGGRGLNMPMNCKDISLMKWQGANSFRTSHYPYSEEMMRLCDEEGIVVIDEVPAVGLHLNFGGGADFKNGRKVHTFDSPEEGGLRTAGHHREVIQDLIKRDKNHACVVMWSIANEPDCTDEGAYDYFKPLFELAKTSDPQKRPCTMVCMQVEENRKDCSIRLSDVICLNRYYGWYVSGGDLQTAEKLMKDEMQFWENVGKPFMFTEYGADTISGFHDTVPVMFTEEYQIECYKMNHRVIDNLKNFVGEQVWNFADFATEQGIMRVQGNKKGIFTRDRKPKMAAYYFKERWNGCK